MYKHRSPIFVLVISLPLVASVYFALIGLYHTANNVRDSSLLLRGFAASIITLIIINSLLLPSFRRASPIGYVIIRITKLIAVFRHLLIVLPLFIVLTAISVGVLQIGVIDATLVSLLSIFPALGLIDLARRNAVATQLNS